MSFERKTLILVIFVSAIALNLICGSFSATSERGARGYAGESGFNEVHLLSGALEFKAINPDLKRSRRATKRDVSADSYSRNETIHLSSNKYEMRSNDRAFQGDAPAFGGRGISGKLYTSHSHPRPQSTDMVLALPIVHCSEDMMTLKAAGGENAQIFVDRVDAAPLPLFQVPAYCGYSVKVTRKDLFLRAPYDGCFVTQEKGNYVLSLLWWGSPIKISCPVTLEMSNPVPSVLCSQFGMVISVEEAQEAAERHKVKVNGKVLPLLSETCAYRIHSPAEVVLLHTPFSAECVTVTDEENILIVILDGKKFTLSCPVPDHLSRFLPYRHFDPFQQPQQPSQGKNPFIPAAKPPVFPYLPYEQPAVPQFHPDRPHPPYPMPQIPSDYQHQKLPGQNYPKFPLSDKAPPVDAFPKPSIQQHLHMDQLSQMHHHPMMPHPPYSPYPISCPPYPEEFCSQYPNMHRPPSYKEPEVTSDSKPIIHPKPWVSSSRLAHKPPAPVEQENMFRRLHLSQPTPPAHHYKMSPSFKCTKNRFVATLPTKKGDSIKVKDLKRNAWISIASAPVSCNYVLQPKDGGHVLSASLPSCHMRKLSSTVMGLMLRFYDSSQRRTRTLQLQCHHNKETHTPPLVPPVPVKPPRPNIHEHSATHQHSSIRHHTTMPPPPPMPAKLQVLCSSQHMHVKLPPGPKSGLVVQAPYNESKMETYPILKAPSHCGYSVKTGKDGAINVLLPYTSCHMTQKHGQHNIILKYETLKGRHVESLLSCQASFRQDCHVPPEQRLVCGAGKLSPLECHNRGCCYCRHTHSCFYPMDECTMDRHIVFSVHSSASDPPLSPSSLVTAGRHSCSPVSVTNDLALFKIPLDKCGVHRFEVGKIIIYMVEILNRVQPITLHYGTITRDSPVRILVECRYLPGSVVSAGYLVKSPSLGPSIKAQGVFGVQLRIAKDENYEKFFPQYHQPLRMLLGKPLYLEVRLLNPPDPTSMLLVHYCVAYPRSANSAWIVIYDGCPNSLDNTPTHNPIAAPDEDLINHVRRFTVTTFQFLSEDADLNSDEEIYFMCSTEVCLPSDGPCVEGCFADNSDEKS